jgi:DNA polymerase-1
MIIAEAPGYYETVHVPPTPLVGPTGRMNDEILRECGVRREEVYCTNVVKHRPPDNNLKRLHEIGHTIEEYLPQLWEELETINPNCILVLGNTALNYVCGLDGIMNYRGSILRTKDDKWKVVATFHPARLFPRYQGDKGNLPWKWRSVLRLDYARAVEESKTKTYDVPQRTIELAKSSVDVYRFLQRYEGKRRVSLDIETPKTIPALLGMSFNDHHAISIPLIDPYSLSHDDHRGYFHLSTNELIAIYEMLDKLFNGPIEIIGQNWKFDEEKLYSMLRFHGLKGKLYVDTAILQHVVNPEWPKALDFTTSIYTREPYYKFEGKDFNAKKDRLDRHMIYNAKDVLVTFEIAEKLEAEARELGLWEFYYEFQRHLHDFYIEMDRNGFVLNTQTQKEVLEWFDEDIREMDDEMFTICGQKFNVRSNPVLRKILIEMGVPERASYGEDSLVALMTNNVKDPVKQRFLQLVINRRRWGKNRQTAATRADYDGRMRSIWRIGGTETGRTSTGTCGPPIRPYPTGQPFQNMTKHGDLGKLRAMYEATPGYVLVNFDLAQAEPRVVAKLAKDDDLSHKFETGFDVHRMTASWFFGIPMSAITKEQRFVGKIGRNGGNYDMGKYRLWQEINTNAKRFGIDVFVSEWKAGRILEIFHEYSPKIRGIFHEDVRKQLQDNGQVLVNCFGRRRTFFERWGEDLWKEAYAWSASSVVSDHLKSRGLVLWRAASYVRWINEAHDAYTVEVPEKLLDEFVDLARELMVVPIDLSKGSFPRDPLVIPIDFEVGYNYRDMQKYTKKAT